MSPLADGEVGPGYSVQVLSPDYIGVCGLSPSIPHAKTPAICFTEYINELKPIHAMKILLLSFFMFVSIVATAQKKVAVFSTGKPGSAEYERLSFYTNNNKRADIIYTYGKDRKEMKLQYSGKANLKGVPCFKVKFPNAIVLYVTPRGLKLQVTDVDGKYNKIFAWEYEGPVNGIGTFCDVCAQSDEEAIQIINSAYLN